MQKRLKSQNWPEWGQFPFILPMNLLCSHCLLFDISLKFSKTLELLISPKRILCLSVYLSLSVSLCQTGEKGPGGGMDGHSCC